MAGSPRPTKQGALIASIEEGNLEEVKRVLNAGGVDLNPPERGHDSFPLYLACASGHLEIVRVLIERGSDVNLLINTAGFYVEWSSLMIAAFNKRTTVVQLLLEKGSKVDARDKNMNTALHLAAQRGHADVLRALLDAGADRSLTESCGQIPEALARSKGRTECVMILQTHGLPQRKMSRQSSVEFTPGAGPAAPTAEKTEREPSIFSFSMATYSTRQRTPTPEDELDQLRETLRQRDAQLVAARKGANEARNRFTAMEKERDGAVRGMAAARKQTAEVQARLTARDQELSAMTLERDALKAKLAERPVDRPVEGAGADASKAAERDAEIARQKNEIAMLQQKLRASEDRVGKLDAALNASREAHEAINALLLITKGGSAAAGLTTAAGSTTTAPTTAKPPASA